MGADIVGGMLAFCVGVGIAAACYAWSRYMLKTHPKQYPMADILRRLLQVGFLVALFFLARYTPWDVIWLLVGGCLGITLPMIYFTYRLVKLNDAINRKEESSDG